MSGSDVEHVSCFPDGGSHSYPPPSSQSSRQRFDNAPDSTANVSPPSSFLLNTQYPSHFDLASSQQLHGLANPRSRDSPDNYGQVQPTLPDPDDFYRSHQTPLADCLVPSDTSAARPNSATDGRPAVVDNPSSLPADRLDLPRVRSSLPYRQTSYSSHRGPANGPAKASPALSSTSRSRQTSFKDLINKFNNNADHILPLPSAPRSRETSRAASPASSAEGAVRSRASSRLRETHDSPIDSQSTVQWNSTSSAVPEFRRDLLPQPLRISDSYTKSTGNPKASDQPRHPSFGELFAPTDHSPGYAIPPHLRRRGSEGSIPSPNPASLDYPDLSPGLSPPTPWYLGGTPPLEAVNAGANTSGHRRVKSDFSGKQYSPAFIESGSKMAIPAPLQSGASLGSPHSRSRIPVSSRRNGSDFVSEIASRSVEPNLTFSDRTAAQVSRPVNGTSRLPQLSPKSALHTPIGAQVPDGANSIGRPDMAHGRPRHQLSERSPFLQAYIAAPPAKDSPPLRSSRPRQPVNNTAPPTTRSKVVQTVSNFQRQISDDQEPQNPRLRERRLPEFGNVDFATRRQRIQQAFNRTVEENERKEEEAAELRRRRERAHKEAKRGAHPTPGQQTQDATAEAPQAEDTASVIDESTETCDEDRESSPGKEDSPERHQLHIDTSVSSQDNPEPGTNSHLVTMDSPTLGLPAATTREQGISRLEPRPADLSPSGTTSGSTDTRVTTFDNEPQMGLTRNNLDLSHRTLLNQIMQIRESSSSESSCDEQDEQDYSLPGNDDGESIPIMLRGATYPGRSQAIGDKQANSKFARSGQPGDTAQNRWSLSSWSSSLRDHPLVDGQLEGSGDDGRLPAPSGEESDPATQSCSAESSTPPSVAGHGPVASLLRNDPTSGQRSEEASQRNVHAHLKAPSLARLGGWDSKRVTQLYLEELARGRGHHIQMPTIRATPEPRPLGSDGRTDGRTDSLTDDPVMVPRFEDILSADRLGHAASLVFRDDWEHASPSIANWMQVAAEDEPVPVENKEPAAMYDGAPMPRHGNSEAADGGLGLAIDVESPQELDSEETRPPPLPCRSPPPPPAAEQENSQLHQQPSDQRYSQTAQDTGFPPLQLVNSTGSSEDSSLRRLDPVPSPQAVESSATSLVPSHPEKAGVEVHKKSPSPEQRDLRKRRHVIKELIDTEYSFGRDMKVVDDIYKGTSSSCLDLSADDVKVLFANSDQIVQFSTAFQDALKNAAKSIYVMPKSQRWNSKRRTGNHPKPGLEDHLAEGDLGMSELERDRMTSVGSAFMTHMSQMEKVYADYLRNHDAANKKLQTLQRNPKVAIWLKECRDWAADLTTAWDLDSLLVKPVQRIVKYPLLLDQLLTSTPSDHPDRTSIVKALGEVTNISVRINEMKKRADLVGQVVGRKRKESDVRAGLSKAFGRRAEKLKQQVGLSGMVEDRQYDALSQKFGDNYFQMQVVMRDVEVYTRATQASMDRLNEFATAIEGLTDVAMSNYAELESKWRQFRIAVRDIMATDLPDHLAVVRRSVIDPMITLLSLHEGPQKVMRKRDKRLMDYARFRAAKERGDKPDKKTVEQGEQFMALNETLKDELPRLYGLTAKLMEACLKNFVQIQTAWFNSLEQRLGQLTAFPEEIQKIVNDWSFGYTFADSQIHALGICNGTLLADGVNMGNYNSTPSSGAHVSSPRRPSTVNSSSTRLESSMDESPKVSYDYGSSSYSFQSPTLDGQSQMPSGRQRADSSMSRLETHEVPRSQSLQQIANTPSPPHPALPGSFPSLPRLSLDTPSLTEITGSSGGDNQATSPAGRYSGFFSSALPMSDSPDDLTPVEHDAPKEPKVLFLAASVYEFNIDRARREAGYPYLTYVAGEIFDVIGEKGELWLARNQDDSTQQVGWIWNKHFAKLSS